MQIDLQHCCLLLGTVDDVLILCHKSPDGDTIGAAYGLYHALTAIGKRAKVLCSDILPRKFGYIFDGIVMPEFEPRFIVSVDVAEEGLLGEKLQCYAGKINLCIDHHQGNKDYAVNTLLDAHAAASCEIIYTIITAMGITVTEEMATALYTGVATDTGCFRYGNTTAETLKIAARLIETGADNATINYKLFELKTRTRMELERIAMDTLEYYFDNRCAMIEVSQHMLTELSAGADDVDGISSIPRKIEGVDVAVTLRENTDGSYKISMRSGPKVNVAQICNILGGGGHVAAAGCSVSGPLEAAKKAVLAAVETAMGV